MDLRPSKLSAEEMAQWFKALGAFAEDTQHIGYQHLNSSSKGPKALFWLSQEQACKWSRHAHFIHVHEIKLEKQSPATLLPGGTIHSLIFQQVLDHLDTPGISSFIK